MEVSEKIQSIKDVNRLNAEEYTPAVILMSLIVVIGLTGNTFAAIFYIRKVQKSVFHFFISCLSVNDAVTNAALLHDIVELFYYLSYNNTILCRLFYVLKHWLVGNSLLFMVAIAFDRYRRVCFPFSRQITYPVARYIILGLSIFSFLIASRDIATVDIFKFNITADSNSTITGHVCVLSKDKILQQVETIFHIVDICIHGVIMCSFVLLNILLVRKIIQTKQTLKKHGPSVSFKSSQSHNETSIEGSSTDVVHIEFNEKDDTDHVTEKPLENKHSGNHKDEHNQDIHNKHKSGIPKKSSGTVKRTITHMHASWMEIKISMMVVVITVISALCFVPYYVAMLTVTLDFSGSANIMTVGELLARRSFILNSAVNPFIMFIFNIPFRQFVITVACRLCFKYRKLK